MNFGKKVENFGWDNFVDKEIVENCWRIWTLCDHCCLGPMRNLGDFSNRIIGERIWIVSGPCEGRTHMLGQSLMSYKDGTFLEHMVHVLTISTARRRLSLIHI